MKILLLNYEYPPLGGGAANATANIARELTLLGLEVTVLTARHGDQPTVATESGVRVHRVLSWRKGIHDCGNRGAYTYVAAAAARALGSLRGERFDLAHYFFSLPTGLLSFVPGVLGRTPYIVSLRGSDVPGYDPYNRSLQTLHGLLRPVTRRIWNRAGRVVALSRGLRETAMETAPELRIDVIGNGVETDLFRPAEERPVGGPVRFITVSRLIERKGIQHIIQAARALKDEFAFTVEVLGDGNYRETLEAMALEAGVEDLIRFGGAHPREDLPEKYGASDVFLLPSMAESFGMVFVEAMGCGLPVIGGRTGGVPDLVGEENGILVTPGSVEEVATAMRRFASDPGYREEVGANNRRKVLASYSWEGVARRYKEVYDGVLEAPDRGVLGAKGGVLGAR